MVESLKQQVSQTGEAEAVGESQPLKIEVQ